MEKTKVLNMEVGKRYVVEGELSKKPLRTSKQDPYFLIQLKDNSGMASQQVWNNLPIYSVIEALADNEWVRVEATCTKKGQYTNIELHSIEVVERVVDTIVNIEDLKNELRDELKNFQDNDLKLLVTNIFNRADIKDAFWTSPASQKSGYSFEGGLATKVVRSIRLSKAIASVYNNWNHNVDQRKSKLNEDLLKTACILSPIGKVLAFRKDGHNVNKTDEGQLFEESYLSMKIVLEELPKINLPEPQQLLLEHVIGSAKGKQQFGALHIPRSREAMAFHFIDALDTQMANFEALDREAEVTDLFVQMFQKTLFLGCYDE